MSIKAIKRHQYRETRDGKNLFICRAPHNPVFFKNESGIYAPIDLTSYQSDNLSTVGNARILNKNIMSVGIREDAESEKFFGIRPDFNQANNTESLEFSIGRPEIDGKLTTPDLSQTITTGINTDLGDIIIRNTRQYSRQLIKVGAINEGFKIPYTIHLKGLKVLNKVDIDGYYIPNQYGDFVLVNISGDFRFRIRPPKLIGPDFRDLSIGFPGGESKNYLTKHSMRQISHGVLEYIKESEPGSIFKNVSFIDADVYFSESSDGYVDHYDANNWATMRNAATGSNVTAAGAVGYLWTTHGAVDYGISRMFFMFDTSGAINPISARARLHGDVYGAAGPNESCIQNGTQADTLTTADYNQFDGAYYDTVGSGVWDDSGYNDFDADVSDIDVDDITYIAYRDYTKDYLNSAPTALKVCAVFMAEETGTAKDPIYEITEGAAWRQKMFMVN